MSVVPRRWVFSGTYYCDTSVSIPSWGTVSVREMNCKEPFGRYRRFGSSSTFARRENSVSEDNYFPTTFLSDTLSSAISTATTDYCDRATPNCMCRATYSLAMQADSTNYPPNGGTVQVIDNSQNSDTVGCCRTPSGDTIFYLSDETLEEGVKYRVLRHRWDSRPSISKIIKLIEVERE